MVSAALQRGEDPGPLFSENHRLLRRIGVSTPTLAALDAWGELVPFVLHVARIAVQTLRTRFGHLCTRPV